MEKFSTIYARAVKRKGSEAMLQSLLVAPKTYQELIKTDSSRVLAEMSKKVFQSGFVWRVVRQKWPHFEEIFWEFNVEKLLMMPDEMLEKKSDRPQNNPQFVKSHDYSRECLDAS